MNGQWRQPAFWNRKFVTLNEQMIKDHPYIVFSSKRYSNAMNATRSPWSIHIVNNCVSPFLVLKFLLLKKKFCYMYSLKIALWATKHASVKYISLVLLNMLNLTPKLNDLSLYLHCLNTEYEFQTTGKLLNSKVKVNSELSYECSFVLDYHLFLALEVVHTCSTYFGLLP